ncbi:FAD-dependent oxidoreductase [Candidatus Finniella inopinata]|uniref:Pyridine nucleotide-disulfide oxidoreductase n=1 Tax=Candidatus Finniella inopinata TaxID=1696036 RepID=A0A4Q7DFF9_9PROT|nr:FAD-dependent oxidoreductase [Candidatus Finniella inopinata]RZI45511.1 pyridine nucleotide-disulfide oxidoreductase [Candidatus Finniella inopinata]
MDLFLNFGLYFSDLYELAPKGGLIVLDQVFSTFLNESEPVLAGRYHYACHHNLSPREQSDLMVDLAPCLEDFIGDLFNIRSAIADLQSAHHVLAPLMTVKRHFVQRLAVKKYPNPSSEDGLGLDFKDELSFAGQVLEWQDQGASEALEAAARYAAWATLTPQGQDIHKGDVLFKIPKKIDPHACLIPHLIKNEQGAWQLPPALQRDRKGFNLTDPGFTRAQAFDHSHYCIHCHPQNKDSCSKGLPGKTGCPLEQKISEMNLAKSRGYTVAALAIICVDNPMVAATGHRICNDCMKACIFQKQEPVNVPGVETQILQDVLNLPWGFEIYSLFTRWNPLKFADRLPKPDTGKAVLVAGMGPAGFTLAHYLLNEGHTVVGIDGLKIEPLPEDLKTTPIKDINSLYESLDERVVGGFGGVAEYGITVRWDKNFLKIIRLLLERRQRFLLKGGVRLGGTVTIDQAFELGFDHVALCLGAGSPTLLNIQNHLVPGVRQASDFLMGLQLSGAFKAESLANLQVRLPILVIGGGLTAIDSATEALAYYVRQIEKFSKRYEHLVKMLGKEVVRQDWTPQEQALADEMLGHAMALQTNPDKTHMLLQQWGGSTVVYRRVLDQAPSYRMNAEEVEKALEEGISLLDEAVPVKVTIDDYGHADGLLVMHHGVEKHIKARTILVAAGTKPNTNLKYDIPDEIVLANGAFQAIDERGNAVDLERSAKPKETHVLMRFNGGGQSVSFFGDLHPSFSGNVVKAMASAKRGYPIVSRAVQRSQLELKNPEPFLAKMDALLSAYVVAVNRLTPTIVEIVIKAPLAARAFQPGQFYRLQNFESLGGPSNTMEGIALTGASVDKAEGQVSLIVLEMGGSSNLCAALKPDEPVVLMGPTGTATELPHNETVLLVGGGLGNAVLFSIGQGLRANGCKVLYAAGYKKIIDRFKVQEIEKAADQIIWCCDEQPGFTPGRPQDLTFTGNIVQAVTAYAQGQLVSGELGTPLVDSSDVQRLMVIGSDRMMAAVAKARHLDWKPYLNSAHIAVGSINSPMQCMMKEICAQCLQIQHDPVTGAEKVVYSCVNQDQPLDWVDFDHLSQRLSQNSLQEKLTALWMKTP